jgi:hypothetical protein
LIVRLFRALSIALSAFSLLLVVPAVPAQALDAFAGICTVGGSAALVGPTPVGNVNLSVSLSGMCTLTLGSSPISISGVLPNVVPISPCGVGEFLGSPNVTVSSWSGPVLTTATGGPGVYTIAGGNTQFAMAGQLVSTSPGCPTAGSWIGVIVLEDPTL